MSALIWLVLILLGLGVSFGFAVVIGKAIKFGMTGEK